MVSPQVVWANWYQFLAGEAISIDRLESRMLVWCRRGTGTLTVDGAPINLSPGGFALLPWACTISYRAGRRAPFLLGGVHLIPRASGAWRPFAAHSLAESIPGRADDASLPLGIHTGRWADHPALHHLAEHVVERWQAAQPDASTAAAQGHLVQTELIRLGRATTATLPPELLRLLSAMAQRPALSWSLADLAAGAGCSPAWLTRMFRRHLRTSPRRHLAAVRLERACSLLRDSDLAVAAVGAAVGLMDPRRFSIVFRTAYGQSPGQWRRRQRGV